MISDRLHEIPFILVWRVSPTNLGLLLNSRLAAYDLGFISLPQVIQLTKATLSTAVKLERFRGHFYNWYDARALKAEAPFFISSVDSGNLACSLLTTSQACVQMASQPLFSPPLCVGIQDRLRLLRQVAGTDRITSLLEAIVALEDSILVLEDDPERWISNLLVLEKIARDLERSIKSKSHKSPDLAYWSRDLCNQLRDLRRLSATFAPWLLAKDRRIFEHVCIRPTADIRQLTLDQV